MFPSCKRAPKCACSKCNVAANNRKPTAKAQRSFSAVSYLHKLPNMDEAKLRELRRKKVLDSKHSLLQSRSAKLKAENIISLYLDAKNRLDRIVTSESPTLSRDFVVAEQPTSSSSDQHASSVEINTPATTTAPSTPSTQESAPVVPIRKPVAAAQIQKQTVSTSEKLKTHSRSLFILCFAVTLALLAPPLALAQSTLHSVPASHFLSHTPVLLLAFFTEIAIYSISFTREMLRKARQFHSFS